MEEEDMPVEDGVSVGVLNPEAVVIADDDGSVVIDFEPGSEEESVPFDANLADHMEDSELALLASDLTAAYDEDRVP